LESIALNTRPNWNQAAALPFTPDLRWWITGDLDVYEKCLRNGVKIYTLAGVDKYSFSEIDSLHHRLPTLLLTMLSSGMDNVWPLLLQLARNVGKMATAIVRRCT